MCYALRHNDAVKFHQLSSASLPALRHLEIILVSRGIQIQFLQSS